MLADDKDDPQARFTRYRLIRDEIVHEDGLIGTRLGWFLASQAFFFSALAIAQGNQKIMPSWSSNYFFPLIPIVAVLSCFLIFLGLLAGVAALTKWRQMLNTPEYADAERLPRIVRDGLIIRLGWAAPVALPIVFIVAWIYVLAQGIRR